MQAIIRQLLGQLIAAISLKIDPRCSLRERREKESVSKYFIHDTLSAFRAKRMGEGANKSRKDIVKKGKETNVT